MTLLTAKDVQKLLQVDRSTVYRMAEDGRLPAIKVGKQWRFPADRLQEQLGHQVPVIVDQQDDGQKNSLESPETDSGLASLLPLECVQMIQDSHAELLGVMLVITDLDGTPVTRPSNPCALFAAVMEQPFAIQRCIRSWHDLGQSLNIEPTFHTSHLGLLCTRGLIRVGKELPGMVVAGCIAPDNWPPSENQLVTMARDFGVEPQILADRVGQIYYLNARERATVLTSVQRVANIVAHIIQERLTLLGRVEETANLMRLS